MLYNGTHLRQGSFFYYFFFMKSKSIPFTTLGILILASHLIRMHMKEDEHEIFNSATEVVTESENVSEVAEASASNVTTDSVDGLQAPLQDTVYIPAISYKKVGNRIWTTSDLGIFMRRVYNDSWDTLGVRNGDKVLYSWLDALKACPSGFRLPRKEEFSNRDAEDLGIGTWWTSNIVNMYTTEERSKDFEFPVKTNQVLVAIADVDENSGMLSIFETNYQEKHSVLCISEMSEYHEETINEMPQKITHRSGTITSVNFYPHYSSKYHCGDCCCDEGDGGALKINLDTDKDSLDKIIIYDFNYDFCAPHESEKSEERTPSSSEELAGNNLPECVKEPKITDINFFPLFQMGAKVKSRLCEQTYLVVSEIGADPYVSTFRCGDTITVSFIGIIKDVHREETENGTSCTYKIFNPATSITATTTSKCKRVLVDSAYKIKVTVTSYEEEMPSDIYYTEYPCCIGRKDVGNDEYNLDFEPIE